MRDRRWQDVSQSKGPWSHKLGDLGSSPRTHVKMRGENQLYLQDGTRHCPLHHGHMHARACPPPPQKYIFKNYEMRDIKNLKCMP